MQIDRQSCPVLIALDHCKLGIAIHCSTMTPDKVCVSEEL